MQTAERNFCLCQKRANIQFYNLPTTINCSPMRKPFIELFTTVCNRNTELAQAVDVMMVRGERVYVLQIKVNKFFSLSRVLFSKKKRKLVLRVSIELHV